MNYVDGYVPTGHGDTWYNYRSPAAGMAAARRSAAAQAMGPGSRASPSGISRGKSEPAELRDLGNLFIAGGVKATTKDQRPRGGVVRHIDAYFATA